MDTGNDTIRKIVISTGAVTTIPSVSFSDAMGMTTDGISLYVPEGGAIYKIQ